MIFRDVQVSCLKFCNDFSLKHPGMQAENFDAHADESILPMSDLVGLSSLSLVLDDKMAAISLMIGISTLVDTNLFRLSALVDELLQSLVPTNKIKLFDADTGIEKGWMVVQNGTRVLAVGGSSARPLQYVSLNLLTSYGI